MAQVPLRRRTRSAFFRVAARPAICVAVLCVGLATAAQAQDAAQPTMAEVIGAYGLETGIATLVAGLTVPKRSLLAAEAGPAELALTYRSTDDVTALHPRFVKLKTEENCRNSIFGAIVAAGGTVVSTYLDSRDSVIGQIVVDQDVCGAAGS